MREDCSSPPILSVTGVVNQTLLRLSRNHQKIYNILCGFIKLSITQSYVLLISNFLELVTYSDAHLHPVVRLGVDVDGSAEVIH